MSCKQNNRNIWKREGKYKPTQRTQHAWGIQNRGDQRYLHFGRWLHFESKVQTICWSWRIEEMKILKINTPIHVSWSLDTKIFKIGTLFFFWIKLNTLILIYVIASCNNNHPVTSVVEYGLDISYPINLGQSIILFHRESMSFLFCGL